LQLVRERIQLQSQVESLLEEGRIKLSAVISDLLGASGRRILRALANGLTDPQQLAQLGHERLRCGRAALADALTGSLSEIHQRVLGQQLDRIELMDYQITELDRISAQQMQAYQDAIERLIELPGVGAEAAHQILAEVGPTAAVFPSARHLASWVGVCPGLSESAAKNHSGSTAKGNRFLRALLCQAAQAAVNKKGSHLQLLFRRFLVRMGRQKAIWAIAHRLCRLIWKVPHEGVRFIEYGESADPKAVQRAIRTHLRALRKLGYLFPNDPSPSVSGG
jgi:transposase